MTDPTRPTAPQDSASFGGVTHFVGLYLHRSRHYRPLTSQPRSPRHDRTSTPFSSALLLSALAFAGGVIHGNPTGVRPTRPQLAHTWVRPELHHRPAALAGWVWLDLGDITHPDALASAIRDGVLIVQ